MGSSMDVHWLNGLGLSGQHIVLAQAPISAAGGFWFFGVFSLAGSLPPLAHIVKPAAGGGRN